MMNITERELLERLQDNLLERELNNSFELQETIIIAFEDAEYDGVTEVIVNENIEIDNIFAFPFRNTIQAYLNHPDSPIYNIDFEEDINGCRILNVYM